MNSHFLTHQSSAKWQSYCLISLFVILTAGIASAYSGLVWLGFSGLFWISNWRTGGQLSTDTAIPSFLYFSASMFAIMFCFYKAWKKYNQLSDVSGAEVALSVSGRLTSPRTAKNQSEALAIEIVKRLSEKAEIKAPYVCILDDDDEINAFAVGTSRTHFVVGMSVGALEKLNQTELEGVLAHEISHVVHGDATINLFIASYTYGLNFFYLQGKQQVKFKNAMSLNILLSGLGKMLVGSLGMFAAIILEACVSRKRECLADLGAVRLSGKAVGIHNALIKALIEQNDPDLDPFSENRIVNAGLRSAMFTIREAYLYLFDSHPPLEKRIAKLKLMF